MSACSVSNIAEIEPWAQVRMGDAWLQNKPYGVCDREIDHDDLGRWFRCASKVCQQPFHVACMHFSTCAAIRYARGQPAIVV